MPRGISRESYEKLREAWMEQGGYDMDLAATKAGIGVDAARKYIQLGDPKRGWEAIHTWYERMIEKKDQQAAKGFAEIATENVQQLGVLKDLTFQKLTARILGLCMNCHERPGSEEAPCCDNMQQPVPYVPSAADFVRLAQMQFRWAGGGVFEQQALVSFMGGAMLTFMKVLRDQGLDDERITDIITATAAEFKGQVAAGLKPHRQIGG